jgi:hypothetical protein
LGYRPNTQRAVLLSNSTTTWFPRDTAVALSSEYPKRSSLE